LFRENKTARRIVALHTTCKLSDANASGLEPLDIDGLGSAILEFETKINFVRASSDGVPDFDLWLNHRAETQHAIVLVCE
jgi:hypothetical protein